MAKAKASIPGRVADRLTMDYPVDATPATTKKIVKGPKGKQPPVRPAATRSTHGMAVLHPDPLVRDQALRYLAGLPELRGFNPDQERDEKGRFAPGGGREDKPSTGPSSPTENVRGSLASASTTKEIGAAATAEAKRITGRDIPFNLEGADPQLAREYAEGVLQGLERFPEAPLMGVTTYGDQHPFARQHPTAFAVTQGVGLVENGRFSMQSTIYFNTGRQYADPAALRALKMESHESGHNVTSSPRGTALHEFGHVLTQGGGPSAASARNVYDRAVERADALGYAPRTYITRQVSQYASSSMAEFAAEAFADVMLNGAGASDLSQDVFGVIEEAYRR